jgi:hypothetical protein
MKTIKIFAMALASTALLASCVTEPGNAPDNDSRAVKIQINHETATRAVEAPVADAEVIKLNDGYLIFTNANDAVTFVIDILDSDVTAAEAKYNEEAGTVGVTALESGEWITGVPGASTKVYLIGNYSGDEPGINDNVKAIMDNVFNQSDVNDVVIQGVGNLVLAAADPNPTTDPDGETLDENDYEAYIEVAPIVARFEIAEIAGTPSDPAGSFTYTIEGFFWDKYYDQMYVTGAADGTSWKSNGSTVEHYLPGGGSYLTTPEDLTGVVFDYAAAPTGIATQAVTTPGTPNVWAYNLLAPKSIEAPAAIAMPALIVRLSNVVVNGAAWDGEFFLTIQQFYDTTGGGETLINQLEQGHIYEIEKIEFDETDLDQLPYVTEKNVFVTIDLMDWEHVTTGVEID